MLHSYKRINSQPTVWGATWTGNDRAHLVRVPGPGRFELRLPDGAATPYKQASQRRVKLIGATSHYVTADLDEGPTL